MGINIRTVRRSLSEDSSASRYHLFREYLTVHIQPVSYVIVFCHAFTAIFLCIVDLRFSGKPYCICSSGTKNDNGK